MNAVLRRLFARQPLAWSSSESDGAPKLRRALGWPALMCIGLGTMLGGIFPTIGAGAHIAGPGVVLSFLISGGICVCVALCYAEFASMVPVAGSAYTYAYATLGEVVAWVIGWDLILEYGVSAAPVASSFSSYAQGLLQSANITVPAWAATANVNAAHTQIDVIAAITVLGVSALLSLGIRESSRVNAVFVILQILSMLVFLAVAAPFVRAQHFTPFSPAGFSGILAGTSLVFFAYIGFDTVTVASEEARNPHRDVPIGILASLVIGSLLYVALTFVAVGVMDWRKLSDGAALLDAIKSTTHNQWIIAIVGFGGVAGNLTVMLTSLLGQSRIFYVMSRDRMLPPFVAAIHPRFRTPSRMTMITGVVVAILAAAVPLDFLLKLVNIGTLSAFTIVCAGILILRYINPEAERPFRAPFGVFFAAAGTLACLVTMIGLGPATWLRFVLWFAVGLVAYFVYGYRKSRLRTGEAPQPKADT
ncbi:MAG: amino acid permease [Candidatus Eremiobacteraeota bacterium]|nr:amino acid permease [Candidatus Eremiobacteraeota bacterium]